MDPFTDYWIRALETENNALKHQQSRLERRVFLLELRNSFLNDAISTRRFFDEPMVEDLHPDATWQPWVTDSESPTGSWVSELFTLTMPS